MAILPDYTSGVISLANGSVTVTGTGTMFTAAAFKAGDTLLVQNLIAVIASVDSNTKLILAVPWTGTTITNAPYRARYLPDGARVTARTTALIELLGNGVLSSIAELPTAKDTMAYFTGIGQAGLTPFTPFARTLLDDEDAAAALTTLGFSEFMRSFRSSANGADAYTALGAVPVAQIPATLTPEKAFRRGNIINTVSQASSVPTGAILERGSNANGEFVKFADGTQICWSPVLTIARSNNAIAALNWSFLSPFLVVPFSSFTMTGFLPTGFREVS